MTGRSTTGPSSHIYVSQRLRLHYADWGNAQAPPLLLLHGSRDHCRNWDWVAQDLCRDYHVIAPDLRGHGDSAWTNDGQYSMAAYVYDLAQLIHQLKLAPLAIVAHSLGGNISLRYAGLYPQNVSRLVVIEGMGSMPNGPLEAQPEKVVPRMIDWLDEQRRLSARLPRRYATIDEAFQRMHAENKHLSEAQARHLTYHGVSQNEDGTFSWKFDNYVRAFPPNDLAPAELAYLWSRISCPTLLVYGADSWATPPDQDGRMAHFKNARLDVFEHSGHWVQHDRTPDFIKTVREFLA
ncbi:hydrolase [Acidocella aquatica]|uniref:Hydrolase n=1 Tax=Acidocella aquatica TaxID=1922313 RepID=A0ABQ6A253_9PROT|nr:alpha/beta hydrolase [Acidocella aquatica]GLR65693.1 hydrolase [Acidocella aquatica]